MCGIFARIIRHVRVLRVYSGIHRYDVGHLVSLVYQAAVSLDFSLNGRGPNKQAVLLVEDLFFFHSRTD